MQLFVGRKILILFLLVAVSATAGLGIAGYQVMMDSGAGTKDSEIIEYPSEKVKAERHLFSALIAVVALLIIFLLIILRSVRINNLLDRIIDQNRENYFSPDYAVKTLGRLGEKIVEIQKHVLKVSALKSIKLSAQKSLLETVLKLSDVPFLIILPDGQIVYVSSGFLETRSLEALDVVGEQLASVLAEIDLPKALFEIESTGSFHEAEGEEENHICLPIFDSRSEIGFLLIIPRREKLLDRLPLKKERGGNRRSGHSEKDQPPTETRASVQSTSAGRGKLLGLINRTLRKK
ncbi:MAG: PAS domain-containing protein [Spirochaetales bacterium]|nr:PAS domain-containing protein [Spirochaetales bacterium]MCF7937974.1 PAS domain-containing protein [Spirochaetales bacterium]